MAVAPKYSGQILSIPPQPKIQTQQHTLEFYLDYVCPFSAKIFKTLYSSVIPLIKEKYSSPGVRLIIRPSIQPWHPSSTLTHEVALAVLKIAPGKFWDFSEVLFEEQTKYFDVSVVNETRNETYKRLAKLAGSVDGVDGEKVLELVTISDKPDSDGGLNSGNKVTDDIKVFTKMNRLVGIHVTPTVLFNGVVQNDISSGWSKDQWAEWLGKNAS